MLVLLLLSNAATAFGATCERNVDYSPDVIGRFAGRIRVPWRAPRLLMLRLGLLLVFRKRIRLTLGSAESILKLGVGRSQIRRRICQPALQLLDTSPKVFAIATSHIDALFG
jgi:hypothetical protein